MVSTARGTCVWCVVVCGIEVTSVLSFYLQCPRFAFCFALIHRPLRLLQEAAPLVMHGVL
jgi:hypothetical protein